MTKKALRRLSRPPKPRLHEGFNLLGAAYWGVNRLDGKRQRSGPKRIEIILGIGALSVD